MQSIHKILIPIVLPANSRHIAQQAAWLARRFHAEVILLHVVTPLSYPAGLLESGYEITARICTRTSSSEPRNIWTRRFGQSWMGLRSPACC